MEDIAPGTSATVDVAFAWIDGMPRNVSAGNVRIVPPPASEFMTPAANPEATSAAAAELVRINGSRLADHVVPVRRERTDLLLFARGPADDDVVERRRVAESDEEAHVRRRDV